MLAVSGDMDGSNTKAFGTLIKAPERMPHFLAFIFDSYHQTRGARSAVVKHFLIRRGQRFCLVFVFALRCCANNDLSKAVSAAVSESALLGKDKQSMSFAMQGFRVEVQEALKAAGPLLVTLAPEIYRPWLETRVVTLNNAQFVTQNRNGNLFISCSTSLVRVQLCYPVAMWTIAGTSEGLHVPTRDMKMLPIARVRFGKLAATCVVYEQSSYTVLLCADTDACELITLHVVFTANSASAGMRESSFASSVTKASPWPANFAPVGICLVENRQLCVSSPSTSEVGIGVLMATNRADVGAGRGTIRGIPSRYSFKMTTVLNSLHGLVKPIGLTAFSFSRVFATDAGPQGAVRQLNFDTKRVTTVTDRVKYVIA